MRWITLTESKRDAQYAEWMNRKVVTGIPPRLLDLPKAAPSAAALLSARPNLPKRR